MKLELVSKNKLKIIFYPDDARSLNLTPETLRSNQYALGDVFTYILRAAKRQTGFDPGNCALSIETVINDDGTLVLYFTKLEPEPPKRTIRVRPKTPEPSEKRESPSGADRSPARENDPAEISRVYSFRSFDDVLDAASVLARAKFSGSRLYEFGEKYFLAFTAEFPSEEDAEIFEARLAEFGKRYAAGRLAENHLREQGSIVSEENAAEKIIGAAGL